MTAAVVQGMPIAPRGMHIGVDRSGVAHYWMREPGDAAGLPTDHVERKRTLVTLYAAWIAEKRFYPNCASAGWLRDRAKIESLLDELHPNDFVAKQSTAQDLLRRAEKLVGKFYPVIEALAKVLLGKPVRALPPEELHTAPIWTGLTDGRSMTGHEIAAFYNELLPEAKAEVRDPNRGTFDSSTKLPLFDIFAL